MNGTRDDDEFLKQPISGVLPSIQLLDYPDRSLMNQHYGSLEPGTARTDENPEAGWRTREPLVKRGTIA